MKKLTLTNEEIEYLKALLNFQRVNSNNNKAFKIFKKIEDALYFE